MLRVHPLRHPAAILSLLAVAGAAVGCGSSTPALSPSTAGGTCVAPTTAAGSDLSCTVATPTAPAADTTYLLPDEPQTDALRTLDFLIGRYLRGEVRIYRGSVSAHDDLSVASPTLTDQAIAPADALATLSFSEVPGDGHAATLVISPLCQTAQLVVSQNESAPTGSQFGIEDGSPSADMFAAACVGCVPDLFSKPATVTWSDLQLENTEWQHPVQFGSTASLEQLSPCALTWEELALVRGLDWNSEARLEGEKQASSDASEESFDLSQFHRVGDEMVYEYAGMGFVAMPTRQVCEPMYSFTLEVYVNLSNLADYGVRNFSMTTSSPPVCGA